MTKEEAYKVIKHLYPADSEIRRKAYKEYLAEFKKKGDYDKGVV